MLDLLEDTQNSLSPLVQCCAKLFQAMVVRNDQANWQLTLNKKAGVASLTIFVTVLSH